MEYLLKSNSNINFLVSTTNVDFKNYKDNYENILLVDKLNFDEKLFVLKNSYLHLFPSSNRSESLGLALIESQMFGLPALIYKMDSGTNVIIQDNFNGFIIEKDNFQNYQKKILHLQDDENIREKLSINSRNNYLDNFSLDVFNRYYEKLDKLDVWKFSKF